MDFIGGILVLDANNTLFGSLVYPVIYNYTHVS